MEKSLIFLNWAKDFAKRTQNRVRNGQSEYTFRNFRHPCDGGLLPFTWHQLLAFLLGVPEFFSTDVTVFTLWTQRRGFRGTPRSGPALCPRVARVVAYRWRPPSAAGDVCPSPLNVVGTCQSVLRTFPHRAQN